MTWFYYFRFSLSVAFDCVEHIMRDVYNGWLIRYIHANGASGKLITRTIHETDSIGTKLSFVGEILILTRVFEDNTIKNIIQFYSILWSEDLKQ